MTPDQIAWWWCCQTSQTRNSLVAILVLYVSNPTGTLKSAFDAIMIAAGYTVDSPQYDLWVSTFQVFFETIIVGELPVDGVGFDPTFWNALLAFSLTTGTACPEPCFILKFSERIR